MTIAASSPNEIVLTVDPHPLLDARAFVTVLPAPLGELPTPDWLRALLAVAPADPVPMAADDAVRAAVRDLLRHGGYKPTGRGKPASEYLIKASAEGGEGGAPGGPRSINAVVDACNVVSLHSGLPISVVDLDRAVAPLALRIPAAGTSYVFNASGQTIDVTGLLCLCDAEGPCANAVKDAQRTKTHAGTQRTLSIVWGTRALPGRAAQATDWYRELLARLGATTQAVG